jgi:hypothetical protein
MTAHSETPMYDSGTTWRRELSQAVVAMFVSFLFFRCTAASFWAEKARFYSHWQRTDAIAVFLAITFIACVLYLGYLLLSRLGKWGKWVSDFLFTATVVFYLKVGLIETIEKDFCLRPVTNLVVRLVLVLVMLMFLVRRQQVVKCVRAVCLILSPILFIYAFVLFAARPIRSGWVEARSDSAAGATQRPSVSRVCLVIFDEWSYDLTFNDREPLKDFPNLSQFAGKSLVFHQAYSPGDETKHSIPSLFCGVERLCKFTNGVFSLNENGRYKPADEYDHIFKAMKKRGYRTWICGFHLPFGEIMRTGVDHCESYSISADKVFGVAPVNVAVGLLLDNLRMRTGSCWPINRWRDWAKHRYFAHLVVKTHESFVRELKKDDVSFLVCHYPVPHAPAMFDRCGLSRPLSAPDDFGLESYLGNLRYTDRLIGEMVSAIENSPLADRTMLIVTSDHSWRTAPERLKVSYAQPGLRHVPFLVHLPGQTNRVDVTYMMHTVALKDLVTGYLDSDLSTDAFLKLCDQLKDGKGE